MNAARIAAIALQVVGVAGVALALVAVRVVLSSERELAEGEQLLSRGDRDQAIVHLRRAARWYAPEPIVPTVPMTPIRPVRVAVTSARTPGWITPSTGTGSSSTSWSRAAAAAVLQATTIAFASWSFARLHASWRANERTSSSGRGPYG